jgi:glycerol-3-phosphate acyltransferase PlsY
MAVTVILVIASYLVGSIPTAYLVVRLVKREDIRRFGSGSVSSSNAGQVLGRWPGVIVGFADMLKGAGCVWVADALDRDLAERLAAGLAAVAGHNWSIFLRFDGGRGLATTVGVLLATAPMQLLLFIIVALLGFTVTGNVPLWLGISTALLPFWGYALQDGAAVVWADGVLVVMVFLKRLATNLERLPERGKGRVLLCRLLYDRDTREREAWVHRRAGAPSAPAEPGGGPVQGPQGP